MIISPKPWSIRGSEILDRNGKLIGAFSDWQNAEDVVENTRINYKELFEQKAEEIEDVKIQMKELQ